MVNPSLYDPPPYDPYKDLVPVTEIATSPSLFVVQSSLGVKTMQELVALARKDQDKFNVSTPPIGTTLNLGAELFKAREKLDKIAIAVHSGGGQAIQAILASSVQMCATSLAPAAAASRCRNPARPDGARRETPAAISRRADRRGGWLQGTSISIPTRP